MDGISLTVAKVQEDSFLVSTIPHTVQQTILAERKTGDWVNLETDLIGKYVEKFVVAQTKQSQHTNITKAFLEKYGY